VRYGDAGNKRREEEGGAETPLIFRNLDTGEVTQKDPFLLLAQKGDK